MTARRARGASLLAALLFAVLLLAAHAPAASAIDPPVAGGGAPSLTLVSQSTFVARDGRFDVRVGVQRAPAAAQLQLVLHDRVISRAEAVRTFEEGPTTSTLHRTEPAALADLPRRASDRSVALSLPIVSEGEPDPERVPLRREGTYPVEVALLDADGATVASLLTYLVLLPPASDESPPIAVALVADLGGPTSGELDEHDIAEISELSAVLAERGDVPVTLAPAPATIDALTPASGRDEIAGADSALAALRDAAAGALVAARPYVDVDIEGALDAGLQAELAHQIEAGRDAVAAIDRRASTSTWFARGSFLEPALALVRDSGARQLVLELDGVEALPLNTLDPDRWFMVGEGEDATKAVVADEALAAHLSDDDAALATQRWVAELASLWFERPAIDRGVVVVVPTDASPTILDGVLVALSRARLFEPVTIEELFEATDPLDIAGDGATGAITRTLVSPRSEELGELRPLLAEARRFLDSYGSMLPADDPESDARLAELDRQLLVSMATGLSDDARAEHVARVGALVRDDLESISTSERVTVTLTARDGTVPVTLRSTAGHPVTVSISLDSDKLEFPDGDTVEVTLEEETTRLDVRVRTRATGAFPLDLEVRSPDGGIEIAAARYTVRSTAVSGVGLVLSIGALLFLAVWWARHWRDARRSRRLVDARHLRAHPSEQTPDSSH